MKFDRIVLEVQYIRIDRQSRISERRLNFKMVAMTSFHAEKCYHLYWVHTQRLPGAYEAASASSPDPLYVYIRTCFSQKCPKMPEIRWCCLRRINLYNVYDVSWSCNVLLYAWARFQPIGCCRRL